MIDASIIRAHQNSSDAKEGEESGIRAFLREIFQQNSYGM
jgi:hypothetical protein